MKKTVLHLLTILLTTALLLVKTAFALSIPLTEYTLNNGLRIVVIEDHRAPVVLHAVHYNVGGADEATGKTGLAHFFEHLMFKGTTKYPNDSFDRLLDENGVERNAFTSLDATVYYERTSPALLDLMMDLEADRMQNLVLTPDVFERERKVVQEERRLRTDSDPYGTAFEALNAAMFKSHPYGRPIVGLAEDVKTLSIIDAQEFYRAHYMPQNAIVVVVGDVQPSEVLKLAEKYYGPLVNQQTLSSHLRQPEETQKTAKRLALEDARVSEPYFARIYNTGDNLHTTPQHAAANGILASILGSNWQSRLVKQLVTTSKAASSVNASYGGSLGDFGQFQIFASPRRGVDVEELEKRIDATLQNVVTNGVTPEELQLAKNTVEAENIFMRNNPVGFGLGIASVLAAGKNADYFDIVNAAVMGLTPQDIQDAAKRMLKIEQSTTLILRPKS